METKLFSAAQGDAKVTAALIAGSRSKQDAEMRMKVYQKVFSRFEGMKEQLKMYSGYNEIPLLSNQYFNATMASYVRSFAGFLSIERDMDQPTALLYYLDLLGVSDGRVVLPNIGQENIKNINARFMLTDVLAKDEKSLSTGKKLIPGSVKIVFNVSGTTYEVNDDRKGSLAGAAGVLAKGTVDYSVGKIVFTPGAVLAPGGTVPADSKFTAIAYEDVAATPGLDGVAGYNNRFKTQMQNVVLTSEPDMLIAESNLMQIAAMQKAVGVNPMDVTQAKLTELYVKLVNGKLVGAINHNYVGTSMDVNVKADIAKFADFRSRLDAYASRMTDIDTALAKKSVKGVKATAYLVGENGGNYFQKLAQIGEFVENTDSTYINDLLGWYKGRPVLRHTDLGENDGYAIHKTADGQLAPTMRGIYLPLTNTPAIGSYNNPTQTAQGVYYQETNESIMPELVQKFSLILE